jgi:hypothetical protein
VNKLKGNKMCDDEIDEVDKEVMGIDFIED